MFSLSIYILKKYVFLSSCPKLNLNWNSNLYMIDLNIWVSETDTVSVSETVSVRERFASVRHVSCLWKCSDIFSISNIIYWNLKRYCLMGRFANLKKKPLSPLKYK